MKKMLIALTMSIAMMATTIPAYAETAQDTQTEVHHNEGYDPAHPLAGKIDEWDLRLSDDNQTKRTIAGWNVNAMLTGQMEQYFAAPVGDYVDTYGNHIYTSQEEYDTAQAEEKSLYDWFCNWLNGMDFESMGEMDRAKSIQSVLAQGSNQIGKETLNRNGYYSVLINKEGGCAEYALTAASLAKALGLKSTVYGTGAHAVYYIQIDGVSYFGQNNVLNLDSPTPDRVYY